MTAITTPGSLTTPGSQTYSLQNTLADLPSATPQGNAAIQGYQNAMTSAITQSANLPAWAQGQQQQLSTQAQIPQQTQYYSNLNDLYKLFVADSQLANQYMRPDMTTPGTPTAQPSDTPTYGSVGVPATPLMTLGSVGQPFQGFTDPALASAARGMQGQSMIDVLNNVYNLINTQRSGINQATQYATAAEESRIGALSNLANMYLQLYQLGGGGVGGLTGLTDLGSLSDTSQQRQLWQSAWNATTDPTRKKEISDAWSSAHKGSSLFPSSLSAQEPTQLTNTANMIRDLSNLQQLIRSGSIDHWIGMFGGNAADIVGNSFAKQMIPKDVMNAIATLVRLQTAGERSAIGGRLTGYLLDRLQSAFPNLNMDKATLDDYLQQYIDNGLTNMTNLAVSKGYTSLQDFADNSGYTTGLENLPGWNTQAVGSGDLSTKTGQSFSVGNYQVTVE